MAWRGAAWRSVPLLGLAGWAWLAGQPCRCLHQGEGNKGKAASQLPQRACPLCAKPSSPSPVCGEPANPAAVHPPQRRSSTVTSVAATCVLQRQVEQRHSSAACLPPPLPLQPPSSAACKRLLAQIMSDLREAGADLSSLPKKWKLKEGLPLHVLNARKIGESLMRALSARCAATTCLGER